MTAVEWLVEQMLVCNYINKKQYDNCKSWLLQEAKEMEKQQQGYSEEEVYDILVKHTVELFKSEPQTLDEFFEKFKKK